MAATTQPPAAPHDAEEYQQQIDNIFSLKRPRDIKAGLASGGKSALKGIAAGTVGLFAAPVVGAYTDGFKGFGQGIAAGAYWSGQQHTPGTVNLRQISQQQTHALACYIVHSNSTLRKHIHYAGVAGAVILPVAGLGVGVAQVIRGAANTPEAIKESRQGRFWDQVCWLSQTSSSLLDCLVPHCRK